MILYDSFRLENGLQVYVLPDHTTPMAVMNIIFNVGSKDEDENKTGFAHLFEHLMFGGSKNVPVFDKELERVGGENNAFTNPDVTNYYITLPAVNIETAFWLESDRMMSLSFDPEVLEVQRKVVVEEFKQRYLNQPYGDVWLHLRPLAYKVHPYKWATIGKEISHIENATMNDVKEFFFKYYIPNNATMVVGGNVKTNEVKKLAEKWFGPIPAGKPYARKLPVEPEQKEARKKIVSADVPLNAIYKTYHMPDRKSAKYHVSDLISDILGRGNSSRLYNQLVKEKQIFNEVHSFIMGSADPGLMVINGKLNQNITFEKAEAAIDEILQEIKSGISEQELEKVKNQAESSHVFAEVELLNRVMNLAFAANLGDPELVNSDIERIRKITTAEIKEQANILLRSENSSTLWYQSKTSEK